MRWYLNYFPMGFETCCYVCFWQHKERIWTISLWDLKLDKNMLTKHDIFSFELFPYGIWNQFKIACALFSFHIWTISLWDLKHIRRCWNVNRGFIWTISLWDLKHGIISVFHNPLRIWTISLWDLKQNDEWYHFALVRIWTISLWDLKPVLPYEDNKTFKNLNYFPMGFET